MRRGFTLIETVISSAIFASVLMMAFTAVAAINRLQRQIRTQRIFYGTTQSVWQTVSQLGRYAQKPVATLNCSYSDASLSLPATNLTEAITIQDNGRRVWMVVPNMATGNSYRVFVFAAANKDVSNRYRLYSVRFTATSAGCASDSTAVDLMASADLRLRILNTDPAPFTLTTAGAPIVTGAPLANALSGNDGFALPWRLAIRLTVVRSDSSTDALPIFGQVVSRTPQGVISSL